MVIHESEQDFAERNGPAGQAYWEKRMAYSQAVNDKVVGGSVLNGTTGAVTVRVRDVLDAVCAATAAGLAQHGDEELAGLGDEALWLCQLLVQLLPREPDVLGLYALVLFTGARRRAQRVDGAYVPLDEQDPAHWQVDAIEEAERALRRASHPVATRVPPEVPGPYRRSGPAGLAALARPRAGVDAPIGASGSRPTRFRRRVRRSSRRSNAHPGSPSTGRHRRGTQPMTRL